MMFWESMNESEEIAHDSECFGLTALVPDLCPALLSLSVSGSASFSLKAAVPPTPTPPQLLSPPLLCPRATKADCGVQRLNEAVLIH